ncbi:abortive infection system toxin AbiGii family protein [Macrococcus equipercicus]|uniref:Abortive phage resistance protein n=1 Tax=Macrococcus equipercicus TaxID=69967 RepID=A0A9Q9BL33_9STAP|nr:abortive infection system toxin AbiGii family protein [Macrococcus equipercicus]UTH13160.1 hypothetical protein KFV11_07760 [Macrococcus equipercicus]
MELDLEEILSNENSYPEELEEFYTKKVKEESLTTDIDNVNFKYKFDKQLESLVPADVEKINFKFTKPEDFPEDIHSLDDFEKYLYNSQIYLSLDNNNLKTFRVNDLEIPINKYMISKNGTEQDIKMIVKAQDFEEDDNHIIEIGSKSFTLNRVPNNSKEEKKYEYKSDIQIISILIRPNEIDFSFVSKMEGKLAIDEVLDGFISQEEVMNKNVRMNNVNIKEYVELKSAATEEQKNTVTSRVNFWNKVKELEELLVHHKILNNQKFKINFPISKEDAEMVEHLLISLVLNLPIKYNYKNSTLTLKNNTEETLKQKEIFEAYSKKGNLMAIGGYTNKDINLFDCNFSLNEWYKILNVKINKVISNSQEEIELKIEKSKEKNSYILNKYFIEDIKDEEKIENFNNNQEIESFEIVREELFK